MAVIGRKRNSGSSDKSSYIRISTTESTQSYEENNSVVEPQLNTSILPIDAVVAEEAHQQTITQDKEIKEQINLHQEDVQDVMIPIELNEASLNNISHNNEIKEVAEETKESVKEQSTPKVISGIRKGLKTEKSKESDHNNKGYIQISKIDEKTYPIVNYDIPQSLPKLGDHASWNIGPVNYIFTAGGAVASIAATNQLIKNNLIKTLTTKINSGPATNAVRKHGISVLWTDLKESKNKVDNIKDARADAILAYSQNFFKEGKSNGMPFLKDAASSVLKVELAVDVADLIYSPTPKEAGKLVVDLINVGFRYMDYNINAVPVNIAYAGYSFYQGDYQQAVISGAKAAIYGLLMLSSPIYTTAAVVGITGLVACESALFANKVINDSGYIQLMEAYKDVLQFMSNTPLQMLYDFNPSIVQYKTKIISAKFDSEAIRIKQFLDTSGEFGAKLYKHVFSSIMLEEEDMLDKIIQGKITLEQGEAQRTKHLVVELENRSYDHCIEMKGFENKVFTCYNQQEQFIDRIVIGENNKLLEVTDLLAH